MDQLMAFAWKFLLPMVLVNLLVTGLWHMSGRLAFPGAVAVRWLVCALMVGIPYLVLSRALFGDKLRPRTYRYA
jgi:NADH-quinone oxidoreductase subunit H